ncbi:MAG: polysaccharide deacetylase family protein [Eubacteriales bacterium]|nr:polysaccharide deacetylase family protein [Eubacteriales bacterium]
MKRTILWFLSFCFLFLSACESLSKKETPSPPHDSTVSSRTKKSSPSSEKQTETSTETIPEQMVTSTQDTPQNTEDATFQTDDTEPSTEEIDSYVDPSTLPNDMAAWWFRRNEENKPPSAQDEIDLAKYDAFYVMDYEEGEQPVYLTFDCGYENGYTAGMLDVLKEHDATATFFVCQYFIEDQPELVKRMKEEGHLVGNHTSNHICMPDHDEKTIREEILSNAACMKELTGYDMDMFFRPPKGEYSERTLQITKNMGYATVFWSLAYGDYDVDDQPGADYVINHFNQYIHPGAVPLIHNISECNAQALDTVLTNLEDEGYTFRSLEDFNR